MIEAIKKTWEIFRQQRVAIAAREARFAAALAYNRLHTYSGHRQVSGTWMCPDCNKVHACVSHNAFYGRQFPACCQHPEGHRIDKKYATQISQLKG